MNAETAMAIEAGLCLEDWRIKQRLGDRWSLQAYARERWNKGLDELSIVEREDVPLEFRTDDKLAAWRGSIDLRVTNDIASNGDEWASELLGSEWPEDEQQTEYLFEEARRRAMATIDPPDAAT
jgi:hypothetical protein